MEKATDKYAIDTHNRHTFLLLLLNKLLVFNIEMFNLARSIEVISLSLDIDIPKFIF